MYPPRSRGARVVADVLKAAALVVLLLGLAGALGAGIALSQDAAVSPRSAVVTSCAVALGAVIASAAVGFFGYALDVLADIRDDADVLAELALTEGAPAEVVAP